MVLKITSVDGIIVGRGTHGNPWMPNRTIQFLETGVMVAILTLANDSILCTKTDELKAILYENIDSLMERAS